MQLARSLSRFPSWLEKGTSTALPFLNDKQVITPYKVKIRPTHPELKIPAKIYNNLPACVQKVCLVADTVKNGN